MTFLHFKLNLAVSILGDIGSKDSSACVALDVMSSATPCVCG